MPQTPIHETVQRYNMLYDFYGEMLTPKQSACFILYYMEDHSLSEIAKQQGITPQAAADMLKRTVGLLSRYEERLNLIEKYNQQRLHLDAIGRILDAGCQPSQTDAFDEVKRLLQTFPL